jgi:hypothetical protein
MEKFNFFLPELYGKTILIPDFGHGTVHSNGRTTLKVIHAENEQQRLIPPLEVLKCYVQSENSASSLSKGGKELVLLLASRKKDWNKRSKNCKAQLRVEKNKQKVLQHKINKVNTQNEGFPRKFKDNHTIPL